MFIIYIIIIIIHQRISVKSVTTIRVFYKKNAIKIQITVQIYMIKPLEVALIFL